MTVQLESFEHRRKFVAVDSDEARKSLLVLAATVVVATRSRVNDCFTER